jgi:hypothetical protein
MNLSNMKNAVTSKVARQALKASKVSPKVLFGVGLVSFGATVVMSARATLKVSDVLDQHETDMDSIKKAEATGRYTDADMRHDKVIVYSRTIGRMSKLYAPAVALGVVSVASLTGSHVILSRRNVALTAAYATIEKAFDQYRERVRTDVGDDKDREYMFGSTEIVEKVVDKDGNTKTVKSKRFGGASRYARVFDQVTSRAWKQNADYNKMYIQCQQSHANERLLAKGYVLLNDVYQLLGMERTKEGCVVGWVLGNGDDFIDFGLYDENGDIIAFMEGEECSVLLDFNVDGVIFDKI